MRVLSVNSSRPVPTAKVQQNFIRWPKSSPQKRMPKNYWWPSHRTEVIYSSSGNSVQFCFHISVHFVIGLCGAVHTGVARAIRNDLQARTESTENTKIACVGDKSRAVLQRLFAEKFVFVANEIGRIPPNFLDAAKIANQILESDFNFTHGQIVYNKFKSVVSYICTSVPIFSVKAVETSDKLAVYDSLDAGVLKDYLEYSLASLIYYAMKESACSEQSSRMTAMDNASKNAGEMIDKLTLTFNRTRQAVITRELIEIISGAAALD